MHGEYKVPGGKLVAVDLDVADGLLTDVSVSGDFFLEPDDALTAINQALTELPSDTPKSELVTVLDGALPTGAALIGFTSDGVASAVRRALGHATSWSDQHFEVLPTRTMDPKMHVALDQVLAEEMAAGRRGPTFRFWDWDSPLVVIGSYQSYRNEIDPDGAARHGIEVVRRVSGGGAMFMEPGNCITFSLVVPSTLVDGLSYVESYEFLDQWLLGALGKVGVEAFYVPINDVASKAGKIAGAAQKRFANGSVVHHVTMAYDMDSAKMLEVLRIGREKLSDKGTKSANKRVDPMRSQTGLPRAAIMDRFTEHFVSLYTTVEADYTEAELARARELVETKFATPEWVHRVP
ncbi:lipoyl protein ligase domain-containing protein [Propionicicella superfundia]|uniref:lipoyl protein ligase domain-containing protein n=1 Tax=Propionicicella superfundia TaxID=348582 RepID=UPI00041E3354|nr:lipoate--protein ligase family protein [Propionicicella superfundia]